MNVLIFSDFRNVCADKMGIKVHANKQSEQDDVSEVLSSTNVR